MEWWWFCCLFVGFMFVCGCPCACTVCFDQFTRSDGTDVTTGSPCGWTEVSGNWEISSNQCQVNATNAILRGDSVPASGKNRVEFNFKVNADGDIVRGIVDYVDSSNFYFAECKVHPTAGSGYLRLYRKNAGVDALIASDNTLQLSSSVTHYLMVCVNQANTYLGAEVQTGGIRDTSLTGTYTSAGGSYLGMGTGGTCSGNMKFDDARLADSCPGGVQCAPLICTDCVDDNITRTVKVVLAGIANNSCGNCANYNATYYPERGTSASSDCALVLTVTAHCPQLSTLRVTFMPNNVVRVRLEQLTDVTSIVWQEATGTGEVDCDELVDRSVPYSASLSTGTLCNATASTCLVTSY